MLLHTREEVGGGRLRQGCQDRKVKIEPNSGLKKPSSKYKFWGGVFFVFFLTSLWPNEKPNWHPWAKGLSHPRPGRKKERRGGSLHT